jgi:sugar lactone lactonase YvrE
LGPDLKLKELKFIAGGTPGYPLNGPKGMAVLEKTLYVADIDTVRAYALPEGKPAGALSMVRMGVKFLNDVAVMDGKVYVTDTFDQKLYEVEPSLAGARLVCELEYQPNGIAAVPGAKELLVVTWGPGKLLRVDPAGTVSLHFDGEEEGLKDLDGVVFEKGDSIIFSSFTQGKIYRLNERKELATIASGMTSPADIGIDATGRLLVPFMQKNAAAVMKPGG